MHRISANETASTEVINDGFQGFRKIADQMGAIAAQTRQQT
jgi:hypothetical protein